MDDILLNNKSIRFELLMISTWFLGVMAVKFTLPLLPSIAQQFQAAPTLVKYTISIFLFGKASGMLAFGPLSEKYGRRRFMLMGLFLFSVGNFLAYFSPSIKFLLFARLLQGFGVSATVLMGRTMINDKYKSNKAAVVFSHVFLVTSIVISFLPLLGSLIASQFEWRISFIVMASYSLIVFVLCLFFLDETHQEHNHLVLDISQIIIYYKTIIAHPLFLGYVLCSIFMIAGESAFNTSASFLLIESYGVSTNTFGMLITCLAIGHLMGTLLCGRLVKKYNLVSMMGTGVIILAASTIVMAILVNLGHVTVSMIIIPMMVFYIGTGFVMTITAVGAVLPFPKLIGISSSASLLLNFLFSACSSAIASHISTNTAGPISLVIAACGVSAFLSWYVLIFSNRREVTSVPALGQL